MARISRPIVPIYLLCILYCSCTFGQTPQDAEVEFDVNLRAGPSLWGDVRFVELTVENVSLFNFDIQPPFSYVNLFATVNEVGREKTKDFVFVEFIPPDGAWFGVGSFPVRPGQAVSTASLIIAYDTFGKTSPDHLDIQFRHLVSFLVPTDTPRAKIVRQEQIAVERLAIRDCVIVGTTDDIAKELSTLHAGQNRAVRSPMFPDFATRYQRRERLKDSSNLAMIHDFSREYLRLIEQHPDSTELFILGVEKLVAQMDEVQSRRALLELKNDIAVRAQQHEAGFNTRFYYDHPELRCNRLK